MKEGRKLRNAFRSAKRFVASHFPECDAALLSGSAARGDTTETSDLDIVIIQNAIRHERKSLWFEDWPVEVFIQTEESLSFFFQIEEEQGVPLLIRLCAEGHIICGERIARGIIKNAKELLENGPTPWSEKKIVEVLYILTYLLEDLEGSHNFNENIFTVHSIMEQMLPFYLRTKRQWMGEGKWIYRSLIELDEEFGHRIVKAVQRFFEKKQKEDFIHLIDEMMKPYGGRYFEGFSG